MFSIVFQSVFHSDECCPLMLHFIQPSPGPEPGVDQGESLVSCHWRNKIYHGLFDTHFVVTKRIVTLYRIRYLHYPAQHYLSAQFSEHFTDTNVAWVRGKLVYYLTFYLIRVGLINGPPAQPRYFRLRPWLTQASNILNLKGFCQIQFIVSTTLSFMAWQFAINMFIQMTFLCRKKHRFCKINFNTFWSI